MTDLNIFALKIKKLVKCIDGSVILDGIDANFKKDSVNIIIGPSGTGKSIFLQCILGMTNVDSGEITFSDKDFDINKKESKRKLGILLQTPTLYEEETVFGNVNFVLNLYNESKNDDKIRNEDNVTLINKCLKDVGLDGFENKYPRELSGGMKKKLGLAMIIIRNPEYLFCDEPDSGLDPITAEEINLLIKKLTYDKKMTTIMISHNLNTILYFSDYLVFLNKKNNKSGTKKIWEGNTKEVIEVKNKIVRKFLKLDNIKKN